jgi:hypothetical protein
LCIFSCLLDNGTPGCTEDAPQHVLHLASFGESLSYLAAHDYSAFMSQLRSIRTEFAAAIQEVKSSKLQAERQRYCLALYDNAMN